MGRIAAIHQKRDLDEVDGGNIEVRCAGNCNGWTSLKLYFPLCSGSIRVRLLAGEVLAAVQILGSRGRKWRRKPFAHGAIPLLLPLEV